MNPATPLLLAAALAVCFVALAYARSHRDD